MDASAQGVTMTRRSFLGYGVAAVGAFIASVLGTSTALFASSPVFGQKRGSDISLGAITSFEKGVPKLVDFTVKRRDGWVSEDTAKAVWVVRTGDNSFITYNPRCTHLGCAIAWNRDANAFKCPCHGGVFSLEGEVMAGPPPRRLDRLENRVEGGKLIVSYQDFRLGIQDKVEV